MLLSGGAAPFHKKIPWGGSEGVRAIKNNNTKRGKKRRERCRSKTWGKEGLEEKRTVKGTTEFTVKRKNL